MGVWACACVRGWDAWPGAQKCGTVRETQSAGGQPPAAARWAACIHCYSSPTSSTGSSRCSLRGCRHSSVPIAPSASPASWRTLWGHREGHGAAQAVRKAGALQRCSTMQASRNSAPTTQLAKQLGWACGHAHGVLGSILEDAAQHVDGSSILALAQAEGHVVAEERRRVRQSCSTAIEGAKTIWSWLGSRHSSQVASKQAKHTQGAHRSRAPCGLHRQQLRGGHTARGISPASWSGRW